VLVLVIVLDQDHHHGTYALCLREYALYVRTYVVVLLLPTWYRSIFPTILQYVLQQSCIEHRIHEHKTMITMY
jgi:hypothetical protein